MKGFLLLICLAAAVIAFPTENDEPVPTVSAAELLKRQEDLEKTIQTLRNAVKTVEEAYENTYNKAAPVLHYEDPTKFKYSLINLVFHQVARLQPDYVRGNDDEERLVEIAKELSQ